MYYNHQMDRKTLITGGRGGIGRTLVGAFAGGGDRVMWTSRAPAPDEVDAVALDLSDPGSISRAVPDAIDRLGGLDTLVLNAVRWPLSTAERIEDLDAGDWQAVLRSNVEGNLLVCQLALPALRRSGRGRIVLVSSGAAEEGQPPFAHYVTAKAALHGLARALAWDAGVDGVLVNVVAAGFTRTAVNADRFPAELFDRAAARTPQRRVSEAADVATLIRWLGSDDNRSVTGEVLREGTSNARTALAALT